jgi:hypothetical protein
MSFFPLVGQADSSISRGFVPFANHFLPYFLSNNVLLDNYQLSQPN